MNEVFSSPQTILRLAFARHLLSKGGKAFNYSDINCFVKISFEKEVARRQP